MVSLLQETSRHEKRLVNIKKTNIIDYDKRRKSKANSNKINGWW